MVKLHEVVRSSKTDEWFTPRDTVSWVVPFLKLRGYNKILCPFDTKDSEFYKLLSDEGFDVTISHISDQDGNGDFFELSLEYFSEFDCVVSNPPFSIKDKIIGKLLDSGTPFVIVLPLSGLFEAERFRFLADKNNYLKLLIPNKRTNFIKKDDSQVSSGCPFVSIYLTRYLLEDQMTFIDVRNTKYGKK